MRHISLLKHCDWVTHGGVIRRIVSVIDASRMIIEKNKFTLSFLFFCKTLILLLNFVKRFDGIVDCLTQEHFVIGFDIL